MPAPYDGTPKIPSWMFNIKDNAKLKTVEIAEIYGIHRSTVLEFVKKGIIPEPDFKTDHKSGSKYHVMWLWSMLKIRRAVKKYLEEHPQ